MTTRKRLIDANACPCTKCDRLGNCRPGLCEAFAEWWLSPVDAVEVVRCKDCKRFVDNREAFFTYCKRGLKDVYVKPDDFCSYGERKDK